MLGGCSRHACRDLAGDLEDHELVRPRGEAAEAAEVLELGQDVHQRVVGALLGDVVELRTAQRLQLAAPAMQLVQRGALQHPVELGDRLSVARMVGAQVLDPAPRDHVAHLPRWLFDAHRLIVERVGKTAVRPVTNAHDSL
ncbi:hypothetical protein OM076_02130 [Solirubrobacter ginsenosidimutans]|uniref:Uncharacterized protein n=1 Tax=Solirubrobacter ginsenosidimutans TaxID=490573 RepID=A0A9X3MMA8_9ACTN|nr:hypothetical protein [Solirubrobacter ginsenosidimutans]MDA0159049.1 hypothetical protein [Solirubrobacter ginsenosidimutans]